jgi:uncharacterized protein YqcC (DUF446 family)
VTEPPKHPRLKQLADDIEVELKKLGLWSATEQTSAPATAAFGADSMTFEEWLQFAFLPNVREAARTGRTPNQSNVATAAVRNLDGVDDVGNLIDLLSQVDRAVEGL